MAAVWKKSLFISKNKLFLEFSKNSYIFWKPAMDGLRKAKRIKKIPPASRDIKSQSVTNNNRKK